MLQQSGLFVTTRTRERMDDFLHGWKDSRDITEPANLSKEVQ